MTIQPCAGIVGALQRQPWYQGWTWIWAIGATSIWGVDPCAGTMVLVVANVAEMKRASVYSDLLGEMKVGVRGCGRVRGRVRVLRVSVGGVDVSECGCGGG